MSRLPRWHDRFVGREREQRELGARIGAERIVTVCGLGGIGKTRLCAEVLRFRCRSAGDPGHVGFVAVRRASTAADVVAEIVTQLDLPTVPAGGDPVAALWSRLVALAPPIVWLDLPDGSVRGARVVLRGAPAGRPTVVVTSRTTLEVPGEEVMPLGPMRDRGAALLLARAPSAAGWLDADAAAPVLACLDGIPLAVELAAARLDILSPRSLAERLSEGLGVLRDPMATHRHASLEGVLATSWELLCPAHRRSLAALCLLRSEFSEEAAWDAAGVCTAHVQALVACSFVQRTGRSLRLLDTVRSFVESREAPGAELAWRHARWVVAEGGRLWGERHGPEGLAASAALQALQPDLEAVVDRLPDTSAAADLACRALVFRSVVAAGPGYRTWARQLERVLEHGPEPSRWVALLHLERGGVRERLGHHAGACAEFERAVALGDALGDPQVAVQGRCHLATQALFVNDVETARTQVAGAERLARAGDDPRLVAIALIVRGAVDNESGAFEAAVVAIREGLRWAMACGDPALVAAAWAKLGGALGDLHGCEDEARDALERALPSLATYHDISTQQVAATNLARTCVLQGDLDRATEALALAGRAAELTNDGFRGAFVPWVGCWIPMAKGDWRGAIDLARRPPPGAPWSELLRHLILAAAHGMAGADDASAVHRGHALALADAAPGLTVAPRLLDGVRQVIDMRNALARGHHDAADHAAEGVMQAVARLRELRYWGPLAGNFLEGQVRRMGLSDWWIGLDGAWFRPPRRAAVCLERRAAHRRIVHALAELPPAQTLSAPELVAAGWPGECLAPASGRNRLYVTLHSLKKLGFTIVVRGVGGYRLEPTAGVRRAGAAEARVA